MPRLLAVLVGCNYRDGRRPEVPPLKGAEDDARHVAALLTNNPIANGELGRMDLLLGLDATTDNIRLALRQTVGTQSPEDTLFFYFSGHGQRSADGLTLYTVDSEYHTADLLSEFQRDLPTRIVLDCCHAGAISLPHAEGGVP
jgi:uncharacterized caspase-like protein